MKNIFLFLVSITLLDKSHTSKPIDFIQNGWIESDNQTLFVVKCNPDFGLNTPLPYVQKSKSWYPIHGYLYKNLPLCFRKCQVQSFIPNGLVRVNTRRLGRESEHNSTGFYLDLVQGDSIRYECQKGYFLQKINSNKQLKLAVKTIRCRANDRLSESGETERDLYECIQYCQQPEFNSSLSNGFMVPSRTFYKPGEQIGYYCKDGYASRVYFYQENNLTSTISNIHTLECIRDGTWRFFSHDKTNLTKSHILKDAFLPLCLSLDILLAETTDLKDNVNYRDLNFRSASLFFSLVGLIIGLLCVGLLSIRTIRTRRGVAYANLPSSQSSLTIPSNLTFSDRISRPNFDLMPIHNAILRSSPQTEDLGSPPSYEQLFTGAPQSTLNDPADLPRIDFSVNLNLSRPSSSIPNRSRTNRTEILRRSKISHMRKKIIDKRRKTSGPSEACSSNEC
ncbi:hypothetical protein BpHYR1_011516 [Brachionus plicatilis]|uniref:Sushi domain-containing protein n=1 Tax=Brachionus plicatilis TaxID=10195 RepID=A0A3M7QZ01_BRAPC|nr:hypothetical protein BpHYR1_011516 [Brachionus plicatilis]